MVSPRRIDVRSILRSNFKNFQHSIMHKLQRATNSKTKCKHAATQTSDTDTVLEIARLQEQVRLLQIENDHLRKYTSENPLSVPKSITPKHTKVTRKTLQNENLQSKSKLTLRGCGCKGKCSSKICGCVKKDTYCGQWCKCNNGVCENQENEDVDADKENLQHNEMTREYIENHSIKNENLLNANEAKAQNSLFSPNITLLEPCVKLGEYHTAPLYFGNTKTLTYESDEESSNTDKSESEYLNSKKVEYDKTKIRRYTKGNNKQKNSKLKNSENVRLRSTFNQKKHKENNEIPEKQKLHVQNVKHDKVSLSCVDQQTPRRQTSIDTTKDTENEFDPMKPKHELPRTPINSDTNDTLSSNISNTSLPTPIITNQKQECEIPAELSQPEVNWEKYQAMLVPCYKCERRFHPFRIEKHVSCCKKI